MRTHEHTICIIQDYSKIFIQVFLATIVQALVKKWNTEGEEHNLAILTFKVNIQKRSFRPKESILSLVLV